MKTQLLVQTLELGDFSAFTSRWSFFSSRILHYTALYSPEMSTPLDADTSHRFICTNDCDPGIGSQSADLPILRHLSARNALNSFTAVDARHSRTESYDTASNSHPAGLQFSDCSVMAYKNGPQLPDTHRHTCACKSTISLPLHQQLDYSTYLGTDSRLQPLANASEDRPTMSNNCQPSWLIRGNNSLLADVPLRGQGLVQTTPHPLPNEYLRHPALELSNGIPSDSPSTYLPATAPHHSNPTEPLAFNPHRPFKTDPTLAPEASFDIPDLGNIFEPFERDENPSFAPFELDFGGHMVPDAYYLTPRSILEEKNPGLREHRAFSSSNNQEEKPQLWGSSGEIGVGPSGQSELGQSEFDDLLTTPQGLGSYQDGLTQSALGNAGVSPEIQPSHSLGAHPDNTRQAFAQSGFLNSAIDPKLTPPQEVVYQNDALNYPPLPEFPTSAGAEFDSMDDHRGTAGFPITPTVLGYEDVSTPTQNHPTKYPDPEDLNTTFPTPANTTFASTPAPTNAAITPSRQQVYTAGQRDTSKDALLVKMRQDGHSYKQIKAELGLEEAESTLRGRFRTLTKPKEARVRKPEWTAQDVSDALMSMSSCG